MLPAHKNIAQAGLEDAGYGYSAVGDVLDSEWEAMGLKRGAKLAILNNRKAWSTYLAAEEIVASRSQAEARRHTQDIDSPEVISD